jgi:tetratricopeptide (TPR) repeat protein
LLEGESFTAESYRTRALAREWLNEVNEAVGEYRLALAKGIDQPWGIRQRVLQLQRAAKTLGDQAYQRELDTFISGSNVPGDLRFWAAEQKIALLGAAGKHEEADKFLTAHREEFTASRWSEQYEYLQALAWYHVGRLDDAERLLRKLRDEVIPGKALYVQVGWLLGTILQQHGSPEVALSLFDEVIAKGVPGPSRTVCVLKRAECLAELEQYEASLKVFDEVVRLAAESPLDTQIDLKDVRNSATAWYQVLVPGGRPEEAMAYLKLAAKLAPPADANAQAMYSRRIADLGVQLGKAVLERAAAAPQADRVAQGQAARKYLNESAEHYLRLTKLAVLDAPAMMEATWKAADAYDRAGERSKTIEVLETFVDEHGESTQVPEALLQLGRAYQAAGNLPKAIERYQENLIRFPRTPAALNSLIPLSDCFHEMGAADKAEQTLLRIVTPRPNDDLALITPEADEYREALFRLGDLYMRSEQFEKAIARYEEALERYAGDPRADLTTFHLADAHRRSAARIRKDLENPNNVALKDSLCVAHQERLQRAHEMFNRVIERFQKRPVASLPELDRLCVKFSHLYAADAVYDLSLVVGAGSVEPFARALPMYEKAAWAYQHEPIAMSAYVQIVNCYLHLGKVSQAWMALQRARWALRNIPDDAFLEYAPDQPRSYWDDYLNWLEKKPMFSAMAVANAG